jgi:benzodiazapine receptor
MGYASHLVYRRTAGPNPALGLYTFQLGLNFLWMPLFFGFRKPVAALLDITLLTACVGVLAGWFGTIDRTAGLLMWPYAAWLGFAGYLTAGVGFLNGWDIQGTVERYERRQEKKE